MRLSCVWSTVLLTEVGGHAGEGTIDVCRCEEQIRGDGTCTCPTSSLKIQGLLDAVSILLQLDQLSFDMTSALRHAREGA